MGRSVLSSCLDIARSSVIEERCVIASRMRIAKHGIGEHLFNNCSHIPPDNCSELKYAMGRSPTATSWSMPATFVLLATIAARLRIGRCRKSIASNNDETCSSEGSFSPIRSGNGRVWRALCKKLISSGGKLRAGVRERPVWSTSLAQPRTSAHGRERELRPAPARRRWPIQRFFPMTSLWRRNQ